jgi:hypothetical protein
LGYFWAPAVVGAAATFYPGDVQAQIFARFGRMLSRRPTPGEENEIPPVNKAVIQPSDLTFVGYYRFPTDASLPPYSGTGPVAGTWRMVDGQLRRFFTAGTNSDPLLYEMSVPMDQEPSLDFSTAPRCTFLTNFGLIWEDIPKGTTNAASACQIEWDEEKEGLWVGWSDSYTGSIHHRANAFITLNETTNTRENWYGPWRSRMHPKRAIGNWSAIPEWFQTHVGGKRWVRTSTTASGVAESPWGCNLHAGDYDIDPFTAAADPVSGSTNYTIDTNTLIMHRDTTPQSVRISARSCGWPGGSTKDTYGGVEYSGYDCAYPRDSAGVPIDPLNGQTRFSSESTLDAAFRVFHFGNPNSAEHNSIKGMNWIDLPDKHGVLFMGVLIGNEPGYYTTEAQDPDGLVHFWYGVPNHASDTDRPFGIANTTYGYINKYCCHLQPAATGPDGVIGSFTWPSTGPVGHRYVPTMWIYDPIDLVATANGQTATSALTPDSDEIYQRRTAYNPDGIISSDYLPNPNRATQRGWVQGGGYLDRDARRIYFPVQYISGYNGGFAVFDIA